MTWAQRVALSVVVALMAWHQRSMQRFLRDLQDRVALVEQHSLSVGMGMAQSHVDIQGEMRTRATQVEREVQAVDPRGPVVKRQTLWGWAE